MKIILNFKCGSCQRRYQPLVERDTKEIDCECGSKAIKQLSAPKVIGNTTGGSPSFSNYKF